MPRTEDELIAALNAFAGEESGDCRPLDTILAEATALPRSDALDAAILGIFERFPDEDGFGVYWSIVHGLEGRGGYEGSLLESVRRRPSPFALLMLNRMLNVGQSHCAGADILALLRTVAETPSHPESVRDEARHFLEHQSQRNRT